jgi:hypothetical protein
VLPRFLATKCQLQSHQLLEMLTVLSAVSLPLCVGKTVEVRESELISLYTHRNTGVTDMSTIKFN